MVHMFSRFFVGLARLTWNADGFLGVRVLCARSELQLVGVELFFWARNQLQIGFGPSVSSIDVEFSVGFLVVFW